MRAIATEVATQRGLRAQLGRPYFTTHDRESCEFAKTAEPIEMQFGEADSCGPKEPRIRI